MILIDGSEGEGGGQILRTSLALSLVTGRPFRMENIRARRQKPGLMRQHLTAVQAAAAIGAAKVEGAEVRSTALAFHPGPGPVRPGEHRFSIGTAGSATLVLQTVMPALLQVGGPSRLIVEGGTHNPLAPTYEFLWRAFLPLLRRMGAHVDVELQRYGFYPAGGGRLDVVIRQPAEWQRLDLLERGEIRACTAEALYAALPFEVARRELDVVGARLGWPAASLRPSVIKAGAGPGNVLSLIVESEHVTEVFTGFGEKGVRAEDVAARAADECAAYLAAGVPVGEHLADQLLLPMALAGGGSFRTLPPTEHTRTQAKMVARFLDVTIDLRPESEQAWRVEVRR